VIRGPAVACSLPRGKLAWLAAASFALSGCTVTIENDASRFGGNDDRWYTAGWRMQRDIAAESEDPERPWVDAWVADTADLLELIPAGDGPEPFTTVGLAFGQEIYTPEDLDATAVVENDRPYAGWLYGGVVRYHTCLDADPTRRRDVEHMVELDLGIVGPASLAEAAQDAMHDVTGDSNAEGWDNQLGNEIGLVLRAARSSRDGYKAGLTEGGLSCDLISRFSGALGNVDTHVAGGALVRLGYALPRSFDVQSGDRSQLLHAAPAGPAEPSSLYVFAGLEGRLVLRDIFLDGNTFRSSHSVSKEPLAGALRLGVAWESGGFRMAYTRVHLTEEFEDQHTDQAYGSFTVGWSRRF
jgi:lipid A 3-O-deacylase